MNQSIGRETAEITRRSFLRTAGVAAAGIPVLPALTPGLFAATEQHRRRWSNTTVRVAFLYPPTESLRQEGYYSWPGSSFDAEGRQREYTDRLGAMRDELGIELQFEDSPIDVEEDAERFIADVKSKKPDGLLLIPFKKGHWTHVARIVEETGLPSVLLATLGILLVDHIGAWRDRPGTYLINSSDDFDAVAWGLRMIRTARYMQDAVLINIAGDNTQESVVPKLGTRVRNVSHQRFYDMFARTAITDEVARLAEAYRANAKGVVEPSAEDIQEAARAYYALRRLIEDENADAMMMDCLPGLKRPHKHVPPCMGFMTLRDEGVPAGCQSDLNATLTLMLVQQLFDRPGFQQNASMDTERNLFFGAHCTCPSKMAGPGGPAEPYILRSHAEAGWGCVPRVLFPKDQEVTLAQYVSGDAPQMYAYSGKVVECPENPPAGGCRTNVLITINEVEDVCKVKGMHQAIFYGNHAKELRHYCQLTGIEVVI